MLSVLAYSAAVLESLGIPIVCMLLVRYNNTFWGYCIQRLCLSDSDCTKGEEPAALHGCVLLAGAAFA